MEPSPLSDDATRVCRVGNDDRSIGEEFTGLPLRTLADAALGARFDKTVQAFLSLAEAAKNYPCIKRAWVEFLGEPPGGIYTPRECLDITAWRGATHHRLRLALYDRGVVYCSSQIFLRILGPE